MSVRFAKVKHIVVDDNTVVLVKEYIDTTYHLPTQYIDTTWLSVYHRIESLYNELMKLIDIEIKCIKYKIYDEHKLEEMAIVLEHHKKLASTLQLLL